jgi:hypothetical protein
MLAFLSARDDDDLRELGLGGKHQVLWLFGSAEEMLTPPSAFQQFIAQVETLSPEIMATLDPTLLSDQDLTQYVGRSKDVNAAVTAALHHLFRRSSSPDWRGSREVIDDLFGIVSKWPYSADALWALKVIKPLILNYYQTKPLPYSADALWALKVIKPLILNYYQTKPLPYSADALWALKVITKSRV